MYENPEDFRLAYNHKCYGGLLTSLINKVFLTGTTEFKLCTVKFL